MYVDQGISCIGRTDYFTLCNNLLTIPSDLWRRLIMKSGGHFSNLLDVSSLAKITDGYTPGHMLIACQQVSNFITPQWFLHSTAKLVQLSHL